MRLAVLLPLTSIPITKQDGISLLYACLQHFLDRKSECPKVRRGRERVSRWASSQAPRH